MTGQAGIINNYQTMAICKLQQVRVMMVASRPLISEWGWLPQAPSWP